MQALTEKFCFQLSFLTDLKRAAHRLLLPFLTCFSKPPCNPHPTNGSSIRLSIAILVVTSRVILCLKTLQCDYCKKMVNLTLNLYFID